MIKIDLSKVVPLRFVTYLLGIVPGLFFESSIAIGNPHFAASVISRVRDIYPFGSYALLAFFLASGLLIGQGFILMAWMVDLLIASVFMLVRYVIRITFGSPWLYSRLAKLQGSPPKPKQNSFIRALNRVVNRAWRSREFSSEARPVMRCLGVATDRLLKVRYGINARKERWEDGEWGVWYWVLGKPPSELQEAAIVLRTFLSCGLAGLTALYAVPALRERYFTALCLIFAFAGGFGSVDMTRWRVNPVRRAVTRLRSVLAELSEGGASSEKRRGGDSAPGELEADNE
jgi:hypothetical protein